MSWLTTPFGERKLSSVELVFVLEPELVVVETERVGLALEPIW